MTVKILEAIRSMKNGKFPVEDANTTNLINEPGEHLEKMLAIHFSKGLNELDVPKLWKHFVLMVILYKKRGKNINNLRNISMLLLIKKLFTKF